MRTISYRLITIASAVLLSTSWSGTARSATPAPGDATRGKVVYERYCLSCHGENV